MMKIDGRHHGHPKVHTPVYRAIFFLHTFIINYQLWCKFELSSAFPYLDVRQSPSWGLIKSTLTLLDVHVARAVVMGSTMMMGSFSKGTGTDSCRGTLISLFLCQTRYIHTPYTARIVFMKISRTIYWIKI